MTTFGLRFGLMAMLVLAAGCSSSGSALAPVVSPTATPSTKNSAVPASPGPSPSASASPGLMSTATPTAVPSGTAAPSPSATPSGLPTATPSATPVGTLSHALVRGEAQADLSILRPYVFGSSRAAQLGLTNLSFGAKRIAHARARLATGTCDNGVLNTDTSTQIYYDAQCQTLWQSYTGTSTSTTGPMPSDAQTSSQGVDTIYAANGQLVEVDRVTGATYYYTGGAGSSFSVLAGPDASTTRDSFGASCSAYSGGDNCIAGDLQSLTTAQTYLAVGISESSMSAGALTPIAATGNVDYATGTLPATSISSASGNYVISGAAYTHAIVETSRTTTAGTNTIDGNAVRTDDAANDASAIATQTGLAITGAVKQVSTNLIVAKYTLDINGYGTIAYPDGSMATVTAFAIQN